LQANQQPGQDLIPFSSLETVLDEQFFKGVGSKHSNGSPKEKLRLK